MNKGSLICLTVAADDSHDNYGEFTPNCFVGGLAAAENLEKLKGADGRVIAHLITFVYRLAYELDVPASVTHTIIEIDYHPSY